MIGLLDIHGARIAPAPFPVGMVVRHTLYQYRGVIIAADPCCQAGDQWYLANKTQPDRNQPWYHVLIHDSSGMSAYAAHSSLEADPSGEPIDHPRIGCYFGDFREGVYLRNEAGQGGCSI